MSLSPIKQPCMNNITVSEPYLENWYIITHALEKPTRIRLTTLLLGIMLYLHNAVVYSFPL